MRGENYASDLRSAHSVPTPLASPDPEGDLEPDVFYTPGQKTIADISAFTDLPETSQMKSVVMTVDECPVLVLLRGDHMLEESKLLKFLDASSIRPANAKEIREAFGADAGSLGPVGLHDFCILTDEALRGRRNMICGANKNDYHLRNVTPGEDFAGVYCDLRAVTPEDTGVNGGPISIEKSYVLSSVGEFAMEESFVSITNESGEQVEPLWGIHRLLTDRILTVAAEQHHDKDGLMLPRPIAPFDVVITPVNISDDALRAAASEIYDSCRAAGLEVLLDDRDERPGVKFKDADPIGAPYRITIGKKVAQGVVELVERRTHQMTEIPVGDVAARIP